MTQPLPAITDAGARGEEPQGCLHRVGHRGTRRTGAAWVGAWALIGGGAKNVAVPDVVGDRLPQAESTSDRRRVRDAGRDPDQRRAEEHRSDAGPTWDTEAEEGSTVASSCLPAPSRSRSPTLSGCRSRRRSQGAAEGLLVDTEPVDSDQAAGTVISTTPPGASWSMRLNGRPLGEHR